jgi:hypothetical protein
MRLLLATFVVGIAVLATGCVGACCGRSLFAEPCCPAPACCPAPCCPSPCASPCAPPIPSPLRVNVPAEAVAPAAPGAPVAH